MKVRIYQPAKTSMQAGKARTTQWILECESETKLYVEPIMDWVGSKDTGTQVRLRFDSQEQAVAFAKERGWQYCLSLPHERKFHPKNYANNFARANR